MIRTNVVCSLVWIALCVVPSLADTNEWVSAMTRAAVAKDAARFDDAERAYADAIRATEQDPGSQENARSRWPGARPYSTTCNVFVRLRKGT
jgi:hypothetical protein